MDPILEELCRRSRESNWKSQKLFPCVKMMEKHGDMAVCINPIALRKTKTPLSFGRFECNRVNKTIVSSVTGIYS